MLKKQSEPSVSDWFYISCRSVVVFVFVTARDLVIPLRNPAYHWKTKAYLYINKRFYVVLGFFRIALT